MITHQIKHTAKRAAGLAVGVTAALALAAAFPATAEDQTYRVVYQGEKSAEKVCMSIVRDDLPGLRRAFRRGSVGPTERSRSHLMYECNEMRLDQFAFTQDAEEVHGYLAPLYPRSGTVTIEQVSSIEQ